MTGWFGILLGFRFHFPNGSGDRMGFARLVQIWRIG